MERQKCIIVGAGGQCRVILSLLEEKHTDYIPVGIIDDSSQVNEKVLSIPILGGFCLLEKIYHDGIKNAFLAIGDNFKRSQMFSKVKNIGFNCPNLISVKANLANTVNFGEGNIICPFANIGPQTKIGHNCLINTHSTIEHEASLQNHCHVGPMTVLSGRSHLGENVFLGAGSTVIDKVRVAPNTVIAAGSVVIQDILEPGHLYAGVPAVRKKKK